MGRVPLVGRLRRDDGEGRIWGAIVDRVLRRPALSAVLAGGAAGGARGAGAPAPHRQLRARARSRSRSTVVADLRPDAAGVPRLGPAGQRRRQGAEREDAGRCRRRSTELERAGARERPRCTSRSRSTSTSDGHGREHHRPDRRERNRRRLERVVRGCCATRSCPQTVGALPDARGRRHRADRPVEGRARTR